MKRLFLLFFVILLLVLPRSAVATHDPSYVTSPVTISTFNSWVLTGSPLHDCARGFSLMDPQCDGNVNGVSLRHGGIFGMSSRPVEGVDVETVWGFAITFSDLTQPFTPATGYRFFASGVANDMLVGASLIPIGNLNPNDRVCFFNGRGTFTPEELGVFYSCTHTFDNFAIASNDTEIGIALDWNVVPASGQFLFRFLNTEWLVEELPTTHTPTVPPLTDTPGPTPTSTPFPSFTPTPSPTLTPTPVSTPVFTPTPTGSPTIPPGSTITPQPPVTITPYPPGFTPPPNETPAPPGSTTTPIPTFTPNPFATITPFPTSTNTPFPTVGIATQPPIIIPPSPTSFVAPTDMPLPVFPTLDATNPPPLPTNPPVDGTPPFDLGQGWPLVTTTPDPSCGIRWERFSVNVPGDDIEVPGVEICTNIKYLEPDPSHPLWNMGNNWVGADNTPGTSFLWYYLIIFLGAGVVFYVVKVIRER